MYLLSSDVHILNIKTEKYVYSQALRLNFTPMSAKTPEPADFRYNALFILFFTQKHTGK